ncbi:hypothetical protein MASR2M79_16370 [Aminivibrio sp.]
MFLRGQSLLSRPSREGVDPSLLAPAFLPAGGGEEPLLARLSARIHSKGSGLLVPFLRYGGGGARIRMGRGGERRPFPCGVPEG